MTNRFQYKPRSVQEIEKREQQSGSNYIGFIRDDVQTYTPRKGDNLIRPLPPTFTDTNGRPFTDPAYEPKHYGMDIFVHYQVGPQKASVLCPLKMLNKPCPRCDEWREAQDAGREDAYDLKATKRVLTWILDRKEEKKVVAWAMPWTLDRDISKVCRDKQTGELYQIDNPYEGFDVSFDMEKSAQKTDYTGIQIARRPSTVDEKWLNFIAENPLDKILVFRTGAEIKALMAGDASADADPPATTPAQPQPTPAPAPQPVAQPQPAPVAPVATPQPVPAAAPDPTPLAFCEKKIAARGNWWGCGFAQGHPGECDFARDLGPKEVAAAPTSAAGAPQPAAAAPTSQPTTPITSPVPSATTPTPQPTVATSAAAAPAANGSDKTQALRSRFANKA